MSDQPDDFRLVLTTTDSSERAERLERLAADFRSRGEDARAEEQAKQAAQARASARQAGESAAEDRKLAVAFDKLLAAAGIANSPTCGLVRLELAVDSWREVAPGCGRLLDFDYPKRAE